jgi:hypothetical protein
VGVSSDWVGCNRVANGGGTCAKNKDSCGRGAQFMSRGAGMVDFKFNCGLQP